MTTHDCQISVGAVITAVATSPHTPVRIKQRLRFVHRCLHRLGISKSTAVPFALGRKTLRASARHGAAPEDEWIEHDVEKLTCQLEGPSLRASRGFSGELGQRILQRRPT